MDYSGLEYGKVHPTDCDMEIDLKGKGWVFVEFKHGDTELTQGQRILMERKVEDMARAGKHAIAIVASHLDRPPAPISAEKSTVREVYYREAGNGFIALNKGQWLHMDNARGLKSFIEGYIKHCQIGGILDGL